LVGFPLSERLQDKLKGSASSGILTTHIGAEASRRGTLFLGIPGKAMLAQVAIALADSSTIALTERSLSRG